MNNVFNFFSTYFVTSFGDYPLPHLSVHQKKNPVLSTLEKLPKDLLLTIFTKLNAAEWNNLSQTNTFLAKRSISPIVLASLFEKELIPLHKSLELAKRAGIFLTKFHCGDRSITDQEIKDVFKSCPNIQQLNLSHCFRLTDAVLNEVPEDLSFHSQLANTVLNKLPESLQAFILSHYPQITKVVIDKQLQNLQSLDLSSCSRLTGAILDKLPQNLQSLDLSDCDWLTDADIEKLPKGLLSLNISHTNVTDAAIDKLPKSLLLLNVSNTDLTDAAIDKLPKGLLSLDVSHCNRLTGTTMDELPKELQSLDLSYCFHLAEIIVDMLPQNLQFVNLWNSNLGGAALRRAAEKFTIDQNSIISPKFRGESSTCQIL